jgi:drug efflux transport system permease protein
MWERIRVIIRKEIRQTLREPRMRAVIFIPPIVQLLVFGFAVNMDVENAAIAWMDMDRTPQSRELLASFEGSPHFHVKATPGDDAAMQRLLDRGEVLGVIRVQSGFARDVVRGRTAAVQILVDGTNSNDASIVSGYANRVVVDFARRVAGGNLSLPVESKTRVWFNPSLESRNYFVPGVIVNIVTLITLMLTAMALVREKEIGTMEQLMVTPIRPLELIAGKTLPFVVIGLIDMLLVSVAAILVFHIPFRGSVLLLTGCVLLFLMSTLGIGLFISTISRTQQQAMMSTFFFLMPAMMLSGFTFPVRNMPVPVQYLSELNPMLHFIEIVRGILLKGVGAGELWVQMLKLAIIGAIVLTASVLRFHKRLD